MIRVTAHKRHKVKKDVDMGELLSFMSKANVRGWAISPRGHTYVAFYEGQACLEELDLEELGVQGSGEVAAVQGIPTFFVSVSLAKNIKKFLSELCRVPLGAKGGPVERAAKDRDVRDHFGRLLDQARLAHLRSRKTRRDVKEEAVRREIRKLLDKCRNKYGLDQARLIDIFEDEVKLMFVEDVMLS